VNQPEERLQRETVVSEKGKIGCPAPNEEGPSSASEIWLTGGFRESFSHSQRSTYLLRQDFVIYWG
jgi:hypothetical protein